MVDSKSEVEQLLNLFGLKDGHDIIIHNPKAFDRVLKDGSLGLGESYMDGWWDTKNKTIDELFYLIAKFQLVDLKMFKKTMLKISWLKLVNQTRLFNLQSKTRSKKVGEVHYDLPIELYKNMLDERMIYSCGYWKGLESGSVDSDDLEEVLMERSKDLSYYSTYLNQAQFQKLDLICRKCQLRPGMKVLDIGCGWGGFARFAAEHYQVEVLGVTISQEQYNYACEYNSPPGVEFLLMDYRDLRSKSSNKPSYYKLFDAVVSIGMFEHVGPRNYRTFMKVVDHVLKDQGIMLLHTIAGGKSKSIEEPWISKYIFPNSCLPSLKQITTSVEGIFTVEDVHNFGQDYDKTLCAWYHNFKTKVVDGMERGRDWDRDHDLDHDLDQNSNLQFDDRFIRMWTYYLLSCAGMFRARKLQLYQVVLSRGLDEYRCVR